MLLIGVQVSQRSITGTFVAIYKLLYNAIPLVTSSMPSSPLPLDAAPLLPLPASHPNRTHIRPLQPVQPYDVPVTDGANTPGRLSAKALEHQLWIRKKGLRRHAFIAGAIAGGVAIMFERRSQRITIAQQLFVRGLQGSYNFHAEKRGIKVPHGDVLIFTLACAQIMVRRPNEV